MKNLVAENFIDYQLLDSAAGRKLERIAGIKVERPSPQAIWKNRLFPKEWSDLHANCIRKKDGGGEWKLFKKIPEPYLLQWSSKQQENFNFKLKLTSFGHCGVFFEQASLWNLLIDFVQIQRKHKKRPTFLNLFGYTGAASVIMAKQQAEVTHVDSSKGALNWGRENGALNLKNPSDVKWIHEDALRFVQNAKKRNIKFDGILADPPSWGHGTKKEVWNFDKDIATFLEILSDILGPTESFIILSSHTHGVQAWALDNLLQEQFPQRQYMYGDLGVKHAKDARILPAGIYAVAHSLSLL